MVVRLTRDDLYAETERTLQAITAPAFVGAMSSFRAVEPTERASFAKTNMTPAILAGQGVPIPEGMRLSSRVFDDDRDPKANLDYLGARNIISQLAREGSVARLKLEHPSIYQDMVDDLVGAGVIKTPDLGPDDGPLIFPVEDTNVPVQVVAGDDLGIYAVSGCAGGGGMTFCGCAGGGT